MPRFTAQQLTDIGCQMFEAAGCPPADARTVVDHLVDSNLFGHDSHGAIRFWEYTKGIREGLYQANSKPTVVSERPSMAVVDGGAALGPIGATFATNLAIEKAREFGVAAVALRNTCHTGRVGAYPLLAARAGLVSMIFVNAGHHGVFVAPFGGIDGKLSSNPLAFAAPRRDAEPIMLDMTTCVAAVGKVWVAANRGQQLPEGWLLDPAGNPTTDPTQLTGKPWGALLPLGGSQGHKGYGLAMLVEILGGALSGQGCATGEYEMQSNGVMIVCYNIEHFAGLDSYYDSVDELIQHVKSSRLAPGFKEILLPGELEFRNAERIRAEGICIEDTTWRHISEEAALLGLDPTQWV